jgi:heptosyltransferase-2
MQDTRYRILVWLPSPMGDAVLCTPALRTIRQHFKDSKIIFLGNSTVRQILAPNRFNDTWLQPKDNNPFAIAKMLKRHKFTHAVLFKNSFGSALAALLAGIPSRIGYAREGRSPLLTDKLHPPKLHILKFKPLSMIDYYLAIASWLGADTTDRSLEVTVEPQDEQCLSAKLPGLLNFEGPVVIIVPGGAFGPSKCWPGDRFAKTADWLIANYNATVVISVASNQAEKQIAKEICDSSKHKLISLAEMPVSLGELKALFSIADLVIGNDTGPRHIAIALQRKVITLFGPNDPAWTNTDYENEIQITGAAPCAPCDKPICKEPEHLCMESITVDMVCDAAKKLLDGNNDKPKSVAASQFLETPKLFFVDPDYKSAFSKLGLTSIDAVFSFNSGRNLTKDNLSKYRTRLQFEINSPPATLFLKRYDAPPISVQFKNWLSARSRKSCAALNLEPTNELASAGISTPKIVSYGEQWGSWLEKRSFVITEKIPNAESLERKLPDCFNAPLTVENLKSRRNFITRLAAFIKKFHETEYRHRDLYFSHIFYADNGQFYLIDLARAFKPRIFAERFRLKDIAQVHYSASARYFSKTDRLRFYFTYTGRDKLTTADKLFINKVIAKATRIARHDIKHGRPVPFAT